LSTVKFATVEGGATRGTTALVYDSDIAAYIQGLYRVARVHPTGLTVNQGCRQVSTGLPPELWPRLDGEEVRGLTSLAVPVDGTGTASVEPVMALPVPGVQKPPHRIGKFFFTQQYHLFSNYSAFLQNVLF
jgi:hypothetical protein